MIKHHERMTIVLIDTNAVHRDPWMRNDPGTDLLAAAAAGECRVVFPQVVVGELRRQQSEWLKKHRKELAATIEDMRGNPVDVEGMAATLEKNLDGMQGQIDASFDASSRQRALRSPRCLPTPPRASLRVTSRSGARSWR